MIKLTGKLHHSAWKRGYINRGVNVVSPYNGRYGIGYTVEYQTVQSNRYHRIDYYII